MPDPSYWAETWTGATGSPWPSGWESAGAGAATVEGGKGRLTAGPGAPYSSHASRFRGMGAQRDVNLLLTFTPVEVANDWYLTVAVRTPDNAPGGDATPVPRGMLVQVYNLFGAHVSAHRHGYDGGHTALGDVAVPSVATWTAGTAYRLRFLVQDRRLRVRVWPAASPEPAGWALDVTDPDAFIDPGKVSVWLMNGGTGAAQHMDLDDLQVSGLDPVLPGPPIAPTPAVWTMTSRTGDYAPDQTLPIASAKALKHWLGIDRAVVETQFTPARWQSLQPSRGLILNRNGLQRFSGLVRKRTQRWDSQSGQLRIRVEAVSDDQHLADRPVFPDPLRAADDQTVNDYWTYTGVASTAMRQLISDQAGPTCRADRRVTGLALGADPGVGLSRTWTGRYSSAGDNGVLDQLAAISIASGQNLGVRASTATGVLTFDIVQPRDLAAAVRFSADLRNLVGYEYTEEAPTCTDALAAGQGDLHLRLHKHITTGSALALSWGRRIWKYIDRRDTADVAELTKEATDATVEGDTKVSLAVTLTDSQAATYGRDWDLGDRITIYVAPPGQDTSITVSDVVREILFEVDDTGAEKITPAVGTYDATAIPASPSQQQLSEIGVGLAGLKSWK